MAPFHTPHALGMAAVVSFALMGAAGQVQAAGAERTLTVTGHGEATGIPDQAQISAGVVSQGDTAAAALAADSQAMNAVMDALKRQGVPEKLIQTSNFSVSPLYPDNPGGARKVTGYEVTDTVTVTLQDISRIGPVLDSLIAAGANQSYGLQFGFRDPKPLLGEARGEAVRDAMYKAYAFAGAAGVKLGAIQSIGEGEGGGPRPLMRAMAFAAQKPTPISAGQESVSADVTITWELK